MTFKYRKQKSDKDKFETIGVQEFMRRFLLHILPKGFVKVRHYGFMSSSSASDPARSTVCTPASHTKRAHQS